MKVKLNIDPKRLEDLVTVDAKAMTEEISALVHYIERLGQLQTHLTVKQADEVYLLPVADIYQLVIEDKILMVKTATDSFASSYRLYQALELLPADFLQISQSEIIHLKYLDHLKLTPNGLIQIFLKNGSYTYSSRRYLKSIKEKLGL